MQGALKHLWQTLFSGRNMGPEGLERPSDPAARETLSPDPTGTAGQTMGTKENPAEVPTLEKAQEPSSPATQEQETQATQSCTPCQNKGAAKKNSYSMSFQGRLQKKLHRRLRRKARKLGKVTGGRQGAQRDETNPIPNPSLAQ